MDKVGTDPNGNTIALTLKHYKEPLEEVDEGYGYKGALMGTIDGEYVQCHECGKLYKNLPPHVRGIHHMNVKQYRNKFQLAKSTALVSENWRMYLKNRTLEYIKSLTEEEKDQYWATRREKLRKLSKKRGGYSKLSLETKNKRGVCPQQLLAKIEEVKNIIGDDLTLQEFVAECGTQRYKHLIFKTFGSWNKALEMLGYRTKSIEDRVHHKGGRRLSNEELLEYLRIFAQENNKIPTFTDFKRNFLPSYSTYIRRFGSISNAREMAELEDFIE